jgi:hypothetical protein
VPVALVGECSIPVVQKVARQPRSSGELEIVALEIVALVRHADRNPSAFPARLSR